MRKSAESKADELGYVLDAAQLRTIDQLAQLASELESACDQSGLLKRIFFKKKPPKGMYLWGGVGRGKTFLMDLFYEHVELGQKKRSEEHTSELQSRSDIVCRLLLEKKKKKKKKKRLNSHSTST